MKRLLGRVVTEDHLHAVSALWQIAYSEQGLAERYERAMGPATSSGGWERSGTGVWVVVVVLM